MTCPMTCIDLRRLYGESVNGGNGNKPHRGHLEGICDGIWFVRYDKECFRVPSTGLLSHHPGSKYLSWGTKVPYIHCCDRLAVEVI